MLWPCRTQSVPHTCALGQRRAIGTKSKTGQRRKGTNSGTKFCQQAVLPLEVRPTFKEIQAKTATEIHIKARYLFRTHFYALQIKEMRQNGEGGGGFLNSWILRSQVLKMPLLFVNEYCVPSCPFSLRTSPSNYSSTASC